MARQILFNVSEVYFWIANKRTAPPFVLSFFYIENQLVFVIFLMVVGLDYPETILEIDIFLPLFINHRKIIDFDVEMGRAERHFDVPPADVLAQVETDGQILSKNRITLKVCSQMY
jgi:hypothetical protein